MASQTIHIPHLGGISAGYFMPQAYDARKPTCILVNSMCTTSALFNAQYSNEKLTQAMNLIAIEPLGHGSTICEATENFTYWDSAIMNLAIMDKLGIDKAFVLGTSQGGWIVMRMAILSPEKILGVIALGTSMDYESAYSRSKGCWDSKPLLGPWVQKWTSSVPTPDFVIEDEWCGMVGPLGFGAASTEELTAFWVKSLKEIYKGDMGRKKARMALICLLERDGLVMRLGDVKCPVTWLQGTEDIPYGVELPKEQIKLFVNSVDAKLEILEGGSHYLNASKPDEVSTTMLDMAAKYHT
ncbi:alpha hydrolase-2 [Coleophoma cylindrospora]|uniref:Alpha hydrolase-2 n=1 Tax=Coleophoma cylindrospora TaxID=1849047 RepID=A0A3D8S824_9HELO|nr:alpha hydrolase-2 [Coleophoma cylindrospora]